VNLNPEVLVIGVGGGIDIITAKQFGASHVTGVELDPVGVALLESTLDEVLAGFYRRPDIELIAGEGRHFVKTTASKFDLIQLTGVDTLSAESSGSYVLAENFLYTVEAVNDYLDVLKPGGILSFTTGDLNPKHPKALGRIVTVIADALRQRGIDEPERHIAVVDSRRRFVDVMVREKPFSPEESATLARGAADLGFVPLHLSGVERHGVIYDLITTTGRERVEVFRQLPFLVTPTTDDRPFFFMFFRWGSLFQPGKLTPSHSTALGQIVLGLLVVTLSVLGALFVLVPLFFFRRRGLTGAGSLRPIGLLVYFTCIGLGFMLFEISLIQRFVLFLGYPTYSLSVTLFGLLVFLGIGSNLSERWVGRERTVLPIAVLAILVLMVGYMTVLPLLQSIFAGSSILVRAAVTVATLAPLGLVLGMFFPLGIRCAAEIHEDLVPWAWGINGCASVTAGVLTIVLAITVGFSRTWMISVLVYAVGVAAFLLTQRPGGRTDARTSATGTV
jgi:SAM-dependent methyltransferase